MGWCDLKDFVPTLKSHCPSEFKVKKRKNWHRHDYTEPDDGSKPVQAGTLVFVRQLQARTFARYVNKAVAI